MRALGMPAKLSEPRPPSAARPHCSASTAHEILTEAGFDRTEIEEWTTRGIVEQAPLPTIQHSDADEQVGR